MPFVKGVSGNPSGRPRSGEALAEKIRQLYGEDGTPLVDMLHALIFNCGDVRTRIKAILDGEPACIEEELHKLVITARADTKTVLAALGLVLDRGYGKPPQAIDLNTSDEDLTTLSTDELAMRAAALLERVRSSQPKTPAAAPSQPS